MSVYAFDYHRPETLAAANSLLAADELAMPLAGGMTLLPTLKMRLAQPSALVDLHGVDELNGVSVDGDELRVGAMCCHAEVASSDAVRNFAPALAQLAGAIGDPQVRNRGTLGGSIANNDPAADYPAALLALDATVETDRREIAADEFFLDLFETALEPGELVTAVRFGKPHAAAYAKFPNPASRYAVVGVFVAATSAGTRVAVTGAGAVVFRHTEMENALSTQFDPAALQGIPTSATQLNDDLHASAVYRAHLVGVMAQRAVAAANA